MHATFIHQQITIGCLSRVAQGQVWGHNSERDRKINSNRRWERWLVFFVCVPFSQEQHKTKPYFYKEKSRQAQSSRNKCATTPQNQAQLLLPPSVKTVCMYLISPLSDDALLEDRGPTVCASKKYTVGPCTWSVLRRRLNGWSVYTDVSWVKPHSIQRKRRPFKK